MMQLTPSDFPAFFRALHNYPPFPWQERLAARVCDSGWPATLDLPTASGKTACIDVAVFAMAVLHRGPRRIFFVVDRRVVVDAAFERMVKIAKALRDPEADVLRAVAASLRDLGKLSEDDDPLSTYQLRGGIYRDSSWVRSPMQPTLIASTVDQVGSRLLFRGYGVWDKTLPIHAGITANDSLILLDEAHCSRPFSQTVAAIKRYREWASQNLQTPFDLVEMTATPSRADAEPFTLQAADYVHSELRKRLYAPKPARLLPTVKARTKDFGKLAETLVKEAIDRSTQPGLRRIAILVNRVRTARLVYGLLKENHRTRLLIGRMRPIDRLHLPADLTAMLSDQKRSEDDGTVFVVATQCLEVGADLDFDAIVTECASIDALLQRFGRLDRTGALHESGITAQGSIVITAQMADPKYVDPIYGDTLSRTWAWLSAQGETVDFGVCSEAGNATVREKLSQDAASADSLRRISPDAPILLPAHLDAFVQTSPQPACDPLPQLFLHGVEKGSPEVQVLWRADLDVDNPDQWAEIVSLCPPVSTEAMTVPLRDFRAWLTKAADDGATSDVEGADSPADEPDAEPELRCPVLRWQGDTSKIVAKPEHIQNIRPGDTVILAAASGGWDELGHKPEDSPIDVAEPARLDLRRGWVLRLHPDLIQTWPDNPARAALIDLVKDPAVDLDHILPALCEYTAAGAPEWLPQMLAKCTGKQSLEAYPSPNDDQPPRGWVLSVRFNEPDAGGDEGSVSTPLPLETHLEEVAQAVERVIAALPLSAETRQSIHRAASLHDVGKADVRFQALLRGGDPVAARFAPNLLAKGGQSRPSRQVRQAQYRRSGLPNDFRHELISLLFARLSPAAAEDDLALHLIASHHGRCRPFAPVVVDDNPADVTYKGSTITTAQRVAWAAHCLDSGVPDRFWKLTRQYGWWGLAYLESLLRLGDWKASEEEKKKKEIDLCAQ